jgi:hypothetical protein
LNNLRKLPGKNLVVDLLRLLICKALYHMAILYPFCVYISMSF